MAGSTDICRVRWKNSDPNSENTLIRNMQRSRVYSFYEGYAFS